MKNLSVEVNGIQLETIDSSLIAQHSQGVCLRMEKKDYRKIFENRIADNWLFLRNSPFYLTDSEFNHLALGITGEDVIGTNSKSAIAGRIYSEGLLLSEGDFIIQQQFQINAELRYFIAFFRPKSDEFLMPLRNLYLTDIMPSQTLNYNANDIQLSWNGDTSKGL